MTWQTALIVGASAGLSAAFADNHLHAHQRPRSARTWEMGLRPFVETL